MDKKNIQYLLLSSLTSSIIAFIFPFLFITAVIGSYYVAYCLGMNMGYNHQGEEYTMLAVFLPATIILLAIVCFLVYINKRIYGKARLSLTSFIFVQLVVFLGILVLVAYTLYDPFHIMDLLNAQM
ncbi:hypothetical protein [Thermoactinomyces sp. DSM 45892]|uniref:hypothetical protein n=1 Tax=Thermoactinomyces sp. DSM 45892 TaxID=1882753 RepID=UPI000896AC74|nr:hypothetical protein [Thermoactinomyces sp. DSM 45892]SDZ34309.1 hypothetical protein SAMN05444416_12327 [Thermoactinomyces sp. DSM 45892]